jgi:hypothetical protein
MLRNGVRRKKKKNMLRQQDTFRIGRYLGIVSSISLVTLMSGCGAMDFTSVSLKYPVYAMGRIDPHPIIATLIVTDKRQDRSLDHLVKVPVPEQVKEQIAEDLQCTGGFIIADGSRAKYSLQVEIEQLNSQIPGYATRSATNMLLSEATMGLSKFITSGTGIDIIGYARLNTAFSENGKLVWNETFSGERRQSASMQTAKSHAVEASVVTFALQEAIAELKAHLFQMRG